MAARYPESNLYHSRVKSQSDSDLLGPKPDDANGIYPSAGGSLRRDHSADDLAFESQKKRRGLFSRLVRPWKWIKSKDRKRKERNNPRREPCSGSLGGGGGGGGGAC